MFANVLIIPELKLQPVILSILGFSLLQVSVSTLNEGMC